MYFYADFDYNIGIGEYRRNGGVIGLEQEGKLKFAGKDTVFRDIFSIKKYLYQMYQALHPEDTTIEQNDLDIVTLQSILLNGVYNDLGFLVRGSQLMILVEAQSTWSPNIIIRALMYLMNTYQDYFSQHKIMLYGNGKASMPKPELYVIYTGDRGSHPDVLSLQEEFFSDTDCCIEAKVKVLYLGDGHDIINQYIGFCRVFNEQIALHGRTPEAAEEIIRICCDRNLLKEYLTERKREVERIMLTLFDQEYVWNLERENIRSEGIAEGRNEKKKKMLAANMSLDNIAKIVKMPVEQIAAIGKKMAVL